MRWFICIVPLSFLILLQLHSNSSHRVCPSEFWKQKYIQATSDLEVAKKSFEAEAVFAGDAVKQSTKQLERKLQVRFVKMFVFFDTESEYWHILNAVSIRESAGLSLLEYVSII